MATSKTKVNANGSSKNGVKDKAAKDAKAPKVKVVKAAPAADGPDSPHWKPDPDAHDYPAALDYLTLIMGPVEAKQIVKRLRRSLTTHRKAKDILRASHLDLLATDNKHVAADLRKVHEGHMLSPVLLVRGTPLLVADGYHRVCASYWLDENTDIPCRLA